MSAWMQKQQARSTRAAAVASAVAEDSAEHASEQRISMYTEPPPGEVCIEDFERFAIDRLRVLKGIEEAKTKGFKGDQLQEMVVKLAEKHLRGASQAETRWKDAVSHFVLRLAYCKREDLRRWFLQHECELFKGRFRNELPASQHECELFKGCFRNELPASQVRDNLAAILVSTEDALECNSSRQNTALLRLAYCKTEGLRRWSQHELFKERFRKELTASQVEFMRRHKFDYEAVAGEEYQVLKPDLVKVQESIGNFAFANEVKQTTSKDAFFKVPFEQVPDLVASRRVLLRAGWAFVSRHEVASLVVGRFRAGLSHALVLTARRWAMQLAEEEADRLTPLISTLSERYLGPDYGDERKGPSEAVAAAQVPYLAKESFPLCMQSMYQRLHVDAHLKHNGRLQLGLFLKGIGLPLEEAMKFWRADFAPKCQGEAFDKKYAYGVRYNYAKEGKRTDYTPYSCMKIIQTPVPKGEAFGCPYKTLSAAELTEALRAMHLPPRAVEEAVTKARGHHYQLACTAVFQGKHNCICESGISHPNQYYDESRKELEAVQNAGATITVGAGDPKTPVAKPAQAIAAGPTPMTG